VATNALVGADAMGALFGPVDDILAATRPKETHANCRECDAHHRFSAIGPRDSDGESVCSVVSTEEPVKPPRLLS
jgi:hypothetical protein